MYLCNIESYLQKLIAESSIQGEIITQLPQLKAISGIKSYAMSICFRVSFISYVITVVCSIKNAVFTSQKPL